MNPITEANIVWHDLGVDDVTFSNGTLNFVIDMSYSPIKKSEADFTGVTTALLSFSEAEVDMQPFEPLTGLMTSRYNVEILGAEFNEGDRTEASFHITVRDFDEHKSLFIPLQITYKDFKFTY